MNPIMQVLIVSLSLFIFSCKGNNNNESKNTEETKELTEGEAPEDDDFGPASEPQKIAGVNLTFENAKVICDYQNLESELRVICRAVETDSKGNTRFASQLDEGLELKWEPVLGTEISGKQIQINTDKCSTGPDNIFFFECSFSNEESVRYSKVEVKISLKKAELSREDKVTVEFRFEASLIGGYDPSVTFGYIPVSRDETLKQSLDLNTTPSIFQGYYQNPIKPAELKFAMGALSDVCAVGSKVFFIVRGKVYLKESEKYYFFAGSVGQADDNNPTDRYSYSLTAYTKIACAENGVYVADNGRSRILKFLESGAVELIIGDKGFKYSIDGTKAIEASIRTITAMTFNHADKKLYFAESDSNRVRYIDDNGLLQTYIGSGDDSKGDPDPYANYNREYMSQMGADFKNYYWSWSTNRIPFAFMGENDKIINRTTKISVSNKCFLNQAFDANDGFFADFCDDKEISEKFNPNSDIGRISGLVFDSNGSLYISNVQRHIVQKVSPDKSLSLITGTVGKSGNSGDGELAINALVSHPTGLAFNDKTGDLLIASNSRVRRVDAQGIIHTVAGKLENWQKRQIVEFDETTFLHVEPEDVLAGNYQVSYADNPAVEAELRDIKFLALDNSQNLFIADSLQLLALSEGKLNSLTKFAEQDFKNSLCGEPIDAQKTLMSKIYNAHYDWNGNPVVTSFGTQRNPSYALKIENEKAIPLLGCEENNIVVGGNAFDFLSTEEGVYFTDFGGSNPTLGFFSIKLKTVDGKVTTVYDQAKELFKKSYPKEFADFNPDENTVFDLIYSIEKEGDLLYFLVVAGMNYDSTKIANLPAVFSLNLKTSETKALGVLPKANGDRMDPSFFFRVSAITYSMHVKNGKVLVSDPISSSVFLINEGKAIRIAGGSLGDEYPSEAKPALETKLAAPIAKWSVGNDILVASSTFGYVLKGSYQPDSTYTLQGFLPARSKQSRCIKELQATAENAILFEENIRASVSNYCSGEFLGYMDVYSTCDQDPANGTTKLLVAESPFIREYRFSCVY